MDLVKRQIDSNTILKFFLLCDKTFIPPLSKKTNLEPYSKKLATLSEHFCLYINNELVGMSCCYCNSLEKEVAFISVTCLHPNFQGKGFGKILTRFLEDELRKMGFKRVRFEVNVQNVTSQEMHKKIGYSIVEQHQDAYFMEKLL